MATWYRPNSTAGKITSPYGPRGPIAGAPNASTYHLGVDLRAGTLGVSAAIYAASAGTVRRIYKTPIGAWVLEINHGAGIWTRYAHPQREGILVAVGNAVHGGQHVANAGKSGAPTIHLHFEVLVNGKQVDPVPFLKARGVDLNYVTAGNGGGSGGGSITPPTIPGAPAPIIPEDDMYNDSDRSRDEEALRLLRLIVLAPSGHASPATEAESVYVQTISGVSENAAESRRQAGVLLGALAPAGAEKTIPEQLGE